jgi:hypothetical protein
MQSRTVRWLIAVAFYVAMGSALPIAAQAHDQQRDGGIRVDEVLDRDPSAYAPRWNEQAELSASDGVAGDHLGGPVALSGDMPLVGAWNKNHGTGAAYVFVHIGGSWVQRAKLVDAAGRPGDWFGVSVSLDGDTALVGAPMAHRTGSAYVFVRHGSHWVFQARLTASDGAPGDWFGRRVSLSGDTALVGAWYENHDTGAAYVFARYAGHWTQQGKLTAHDGFAEDYFGTSVALSDGTALIGAAGRNDNTGAAYVFVRHGSHWMQQDTLTAGDGKSGDTFGGSLALNGGTALVGAGFANRNAGAAYVFVRVGSRWVQQARLAATDGVASDWFGVSVALSGDTALVGAWYKNHDAGAAYVFTRQAGQWSQQTKLTPGDGRAGDYFGSSVALSASTGLVGAGFKHNATGAAYAFSRARSTLPAVRTVLPCGSCV